MKDVPVTQRATRIACFLSFAAIISLVGLMAGNAFQWVPGGSNIAFLSLNFGYAPFLAYLFYASSRYPIFTTRWASKRWMVFGGEISYSVYLVQFWVFSMVSGFGSPALTPLAVMNSMIKILLIMGMATVVAFGTYSLIEMPGRRWIRSRLSLSARRRQGMSEAAVSPG